VGQRGCHKDDLAYPSLTGSFKKVVRGINNFALFARGNRSVEAQQALSVFKIGGDQMVSI